MMACELTTLQVINRAVQMRKGKYKEVPSSQVSHVIK